MDIRKFSLSSDSQSRHSLSANADPNSSEPNHNTNSSPSMPTVETPNSLSTMTTRSTGSTSTATSTPADLPSPMPFNMQDKLAIVKDGPNQPRDCSYPKRRFSNGNLSFNPSWFDQSIASNWLEYSPIADKMYCFSCHLFSLSSDTSDLKWSLQGVNNWKKGLEEIKKHSISMHHMYDEASRLDFLQADRHIDVMIDSSRRE